MLNTRLVFFLAAGVVGLVGASCGVFIDNGDSTTGGTAAAPGTGGTGGTGGVPSGKGVGAPCQSGVECRSPLACAVATMTCQPDGDGVPGSNCTLSADCLPTLYCSVTGQCVPRSVTTQPAGGPCTTEGDCVAGNACILQGLSGVCTMAGTADIGTACMMQSQCLAGLLCAGSVCQSPLGVPRWTGAVCSSGEETIPKIHFKVPRAADPPSSDFYSLPFPNDIRLKGGKVSMKGFPTPGIAFLPFDPVDEYLKAIEADTTGFALNATVFFRFSRNPNFDSLKDDDGTEEISFWNITKNKKLGHSWNGTTGRSPYICDRHIRVRPGSNLEPGQTYAVVFQKSFVDSAGQPFVRDADFEAVMGAAAPADPDLAAAWTAYKPFRDWVANAASKQTAANILAAAVFTTQKVEDPLAALRKATVDMSAQLKAKGLVKCADGVTSPCDDGLMGDAHTRGCFAAPANANFDEYQGKVSFPIWQAGTRPYENPKDGGAITFDATTGVPTLVGMEDVCIAVTVPKSTMPASGWPAVVYGHGTGGNYREFVNTWAQDFAAGVIHSGGAASPMVMIGYDGALHGTRTGPTTRKIDELVFNILNPASARDTAVQGGADLFVLAQTASQLTAPVKLDGAKLMVYGHSQGANAAAIAAGFEPLYKAVVLSGSGATLALSLVSKKKPVDIAAALPVAIQDLTLNTNAPLDHPLISVMQMYFERSDPANFVHRIFFEPRMGVGPKNLLHVYGTKDSFSPELTQQSLANLAHIPTMKPVVDPYDGHQPIDSPVKSNTLPIGFEAMKTTAAQAQFIPADYDGHFVSSRHPGGRKVVIQLLGTTARDGVGTVSAP